MSQITDPYLISNVIATAQRQNDGPTKKYLAYLVEPKYGLSQASYSYLSEDELDVLISKVQDELTNAGSMHLSMLIDTELARSIPFNTKTKVTTA